MAPFSKRRCGFSLGEADLGDVLDSDVSWAVSSCLRSSVVNWVLTDRATLLVMGKRAEGSVGGITPISHSTFSKHSYHSEREKPSGSSL